MFFEDIVNGQDFNEKLELIQNLYEYHLNINLPAIKLADRELRERVILFSDSKIQVSQLFVLKLKNVAHLQSLIADLGPSKNILTSHSKSNGSFKYPVRCSFTTFTCP
jgi:hypothetical protein